MQRIPADIDPSRAAEETPQAWLCDFAQGSEEWHRARRLAVGGSTIGAVLGNSRYKTRTQAIRDMIYCPPLQMTTIITRGSVGEAHVREYLQKALGFAGVREIGIAIHKAAPWMRASPDGLYTTPAGELGMLEIKVVSSQGRREAFNAAWDRMIGGEGQAGDPIPDEHWHQIHYTAGVLGAAEIAYCVYVYPSSALLDDSHIDVFLLRPDKELFENTHVPAARAAYLEAKRAADWMHPGTGVHQASGASGTSIVQEPTS
jgi:putative phage-type endonuclease